MNGRERGVLVWAALLLSIVAVVLSGFALHSTAPPVQTSAEEIAEEAYQQVLAEVWEDVKPLFDQSDVRIPEGPASFRDLSGPMLAPIEEVPESVDPGEGGDPKGP